MESENREEINVKSEQVRLLYARGMVLLPINLLVFAALAWLKTPWETDWGMVWSVGLALLLLGMFGLVAMGRRILPAQLERWRYPFIGGLLLIGLLWSAALLQLMIEPFTSAELWSFSLIGVVVLFSAMLVSMDGLASATFLLAVLLPLFAGMLLTPLALPEGGWIGLIVYVCSLVVLVIWSVLNQQRLLLFAANRSLLRERMLQAEGQLSELTNRLSMENDQRRDVERELSLAKEAAETANMAKTEFLATMSHEIRTPLNGILPILEMLRETKLSAEQRQFVMTALNSTQLLLSIINDILDFSKVEAGKLELEFIELNVRELVEQVTSLMTNAADRRGLKLKHKVAPEVPRSARGDPIRLRQILTNLVSNAVKFTEKGGISVEISLRHASRTEVELLFAVRDTGIGMSEKHVNRLFRPFSQADASTTRKHGGTGLGLAICKRLTELMGGRIGVKSVRGKGSLFWFVVPLRKSLEEVPSARRDLQGVRALILGGDAEETDQIAHHMLDWGMVVEQSGDHYDALNKLKASATLGESWMYELVVIDVRGLVPNVIQLIEDIRALPHMSGVEFLILSGDGAEVKKLKKMGVDVLLAPFRRIEIERRVKRIFDVQEGYGGSHSLPDDLIPRMPDETFTWDDNQAAKNILSRNKDGEKQTVQHTPLVGHVLVVEDNPVNMAVVKKMLQRAGLTPVTAMDGAEALKMVGEENFDVVLMDCQMPRMDGYESTEAIRNREEMNGLSRLPIIAMTANAMAGDRERCLAAGMDDYLAKPVKPSALENMLRQWLPMREVLEEDDDFDGLSSGDSELEFDSRELGREVRNMVSEGQSVIDLGVVEELVEIMDADFIAVLNSYLENAPILMQGIADAVAAEDLEALVGPAHSLKSSSANVGAIELSTLAKELEFMGRQGEGSDLDEKHRRIEEVYSLSEKELQAIVERGSVI
ncbi:hybrid sensor histidine kinase/response regulator [Candidatus Endoriftia persephone]|jgi:signal transduction histidine kinase/DNA-binding response OmpR family regulator/HPt (histidine-containing phosphotransfer) domain-containing protein|uniref:Sensory/regulatory protein RpfC n=3 Tax=Gammaproteobacteria TaxID=1236 RepID=G2FHU7_9GAMM|nr:hybrid sensor histidine kinase/response regulator [Candidatus Endoriftia persephone]EGW53626.1 sensor protein GacS [endosymbiont of Tevnia jerichonana (vent Tica)]USF88372.1 ATP-binding protein [Candidatus Endoriftia persephone]